MSTRMVGPITAFWRALWHLCPNCNSDAPEKDMCPICRGYSGYPRLAVTAQWLADLMELSNQ